MMRSLVKERTPTPRLTSESCLQRNTKGLTGLNRPQPQLHLVHLVHLVFPESRVCPVLPEGQECRVCLECPVVPAPRVLRERPSLLANQLVQLPQLVLAVPIAVVL